MNTFIEITPILIIVVVDQVEKIKERLDKRDNKNYDIDLLRGLQNQELLRAKTISDELGIECIQTLSNEVEYVKSLIERML